MAGGRHQVGGLALVLGGLLGAGFAAIHYLFTHGSTQEARHRTDPLLALEGADWCRLQIIQLGLLFAGLVLALSAGVASPAR